MIPKNRMVRSANDAATDYGANTAGVHIPLPFDDAVTGLLGVKPEKKTAPATEKPKRKAATKATTTEKAGKPASRKPKS